MTPADSIDNYREVTAEEKQLLEKSDAAWSRPPQELIDRWNWRFWPRRETMSYCYGRYNEETGFFESGRDEYMVKNISTEHARAILTVAEGKGINTSNTELANAFTDSVGCTKLMTLPPLFLLDGTSLAGMCTNQIKLQGVSVICHSWNRRHTVSDLRQAFMGCNGLKWILGRLALSESTKFDRYTFGACYSLEHLQLHNLATSISLSDCPLLSLDSFLYLINNAGNGSTPISITVHPDVWAKMTADDVPVPGTDSLDWSNYQPNLLRDSERTVTNNKYPTATYNLAAIAPKAGETVTVMLNGELGEGKTSFDWYNSGGLVPLGALGKPTDGRILLTKAWRTSSGSQSASNTYVNFYALPANVVVDSTISHVKLALGTHTDMEWTMCSDDIEDPDLRERTKWRELPALAAARNISFVTN